MDIGFLSSLLDNGVLGIITVASIVANVKLFNVIMTREDKHDTDIKIMVDSFRPILDGVVKNGELATSKGQEVLDLVKELAKKNA